MNRVVISTIGTSLLTNQINRQTENLWYSYLRDTANLEEEKLPDEATSILFTLQERAEKQLKTPNIAAIRRASAELNGIYGLYQEKLEQGQQDTHWLITTDTAQGNVAAELVRSFLQAHSINNVNIYTPSQLSTANTASFERGIARLIAWMREVIYPYQGKAKIYFNLVGSFKSLQGYLNTIGMFYADEIVYIFEGDKSELISIPRLPLAIDFAQVEPFKVALAMINAGDIPARTEVARKVPEAYIFSDGQEITLSVIGKLVWDQCKEELLSQKLLKFPRFQYQDSFVEDYQNIQNQQEKVKLQETIAKAAQLLEVSGGNIAVLKKDGGTQYNRYKNTNAIDHFRVDLSQRVSCKAIGGEVILRHYGTHNYVETKELKN